MKQFKEQTDDLFQTTQFTLTPSMEICQSDYPTDWYQPDFIPYAKEYQALPNRKLSTICEWMEPYLQQAKDHFGDELMLLAHYYMGGEIVKLIEHFGGEIGDSYQLALKAKNHPEKSIIVESAVHFMAESIAMLASPHQKVYITNPKAGCTMEMLAKDYMVEPALSALNERYGQENILPICYMNTSGRVKALCGAQGGAVCTSSNVEKIVRWAFEQNKKVLFIPDQHMGENVAHWLGLNKDQLAYWPGGFKSVNFDFFGQTASEFKHYDQAQMILFESHCAVHTVYQPQQVDYWREQGFYTIAHPECTHVVVSQVDGYGSTEYIYQQVMNDLAQTGKYAVATENHMVQNLKEQAALKGIQVVNMAEAKLSQPNKPMGCGCATMSRNDPPHLVALLDCLRQGKLLPENQVLAGDVVNEKTGQRSRLSADDQSWVTQHAKQALQTMIEITER